VKLDTRFIRRYERRGANITTSFVCVARMHPPWLWRFFTNEWISCSVWQTVWTN